MSRVIASPSIRYGGDGTIVEHGVWLNQPGEVHFAVDGQAGFVVSDVRYGIDGSGTDDRCANSSICRCDCSCGRSVCVGERFCVAQCLCSRLQRDDGRAFLRTRGVDLALCAVHRSLYASRP